MKPYVAVIVGSIVPLAMGAALVWWFKTPSTATMKLPPPVLVSAVSSTAAAASATPDSSSLSADEQGLGTPEAFLAAIYKHYEDDDHGKPNFSTLNHPSEYYDPDLVALLDEDNRLNGGEVGAIEIDPICQCQDRDTIKTTIRIVRQDGRSARAVATLKMSWAEVPPYTVTYDLVRVEGRWRIHDIAGEYPSLRDLIRKSNEDARKQPAEASSST